MIQRKSLRAERIAASIHKALAVLIKKHVRFPNVTLLTISEVVLTPDLGLAKVYINMLGALTVDEAAIVRLLNAEKNLLRTRMAATLSLRKVPDLRFIFDKTQSDGSRLSYLIDKLP